MNNPDPAERMRIAATESFWRSASLLNGLRILIAMGLLSVPWLINPEILAELRHGHAFLWISATYLAVSLLAAIPLSRRWPVFQLLLSLQATGDTLFIISLMYMAGGIRSGVGLMLLPFLAAAGIISRGRLALFHASVAAVALLLEHAYRVIGLEGRTADFFQVAMLALGCMATALLAYRLAQYATESQILAERRGIDLANMAQINQLVIQDVSDGVVVLDELGNVRQFNQQAERLLGMGQIQVQTPLEDCAPALGAAVANWRAGDSVLRQIGIVATRQTVRPRFMPIGNGAGLVVFLEDTSRIRREAEQLKLAALGRLTASIAHEIRNPLGAISHAAQLLSEEVEDASGRRLTRIINENVTRLDGMVRSVLDLNRRDRAQPVRIALKTWLDRFVDEFREFEHIPAVITLQCPDEAYIRFDPQQLHQVMWNLCRNGWRYGHRLDGSLGITAIATDAGMTLDVADDGPGVPTELVTQLFEPFFTTDAKGTGLGLYIAREICAANEAVLEYIPQAHGARFRILFSSQIA